MARRPSKAVTRRLSRVERRSAFLAEAGQMFDGLEEWYDQHPTASFGEIEAEARQRRRELMGKGLAVLINGRDTGYQIAPPTCGECGKPMDFEDYRAKTVFGLEGDTALSRAYYVCPRCAGQTLSPPRPDAAAAPGSLE
jgi:hypothetical protein